jgi:hypothetical protein
MGLICLAPPVALTGSYGSIVSVMLLAVVWMGCVFADGVRKVGAMPALVVESSLVAFISVLALVETPVLLPALAIPPFIGGMVRGVRGTLEVIGAEVIVAGSVILASSGIRLDEHTGVQLFSAFAAGVGLGSIAGFFHEARESRSDTGSSYRDARALLTQLRDLSGSLVGGLDPVRISQGILDTAREELPFTGAVVYVETPHGHTPLLEGDVSDAGADNTAVLEQVFRTGRPVLDGPWVAVPLVTDAGLVGAITGALLPHRLSLTALHQVLDHLVRTLRREALQLDTALIFAGLRDEGEGKTLGQRLEALAAHIGSRSGISVEVEVTEGSKRLRPEVEAELLRIAQEGINNAARHAAARRITVEVVVQAPDASVRVADDGRGLQSGRDDSHGVRIMKERARRIGARLQLHNREDGPGAELVVRLGETSRLEGPGEREDIAS